MKKLAAFIPLIASLVVPSTLWAETTLNVKSTSKNVNHAASPASVVDGTVAREKLQRDVKALLYQERFAELEKLARRLRSTKERFPEGHWKLLYFYRGLDQPPRNTSWDRHFSLLEKWRQEYPASVTPRVAAAGAWLTYGWQARGGGYANSVTPDRWKLLKERVAKAYDLVKESPTKGEPDCPGRHDTLLLIAKAAGWPQERFQATFQEAVKFEPAYITFYVNAMDYVTPKWQGDEETLLAFIETADATAGNPAERELYARLAVGLWGETWTSFNELRVSWAKFKQGYRDMEKKYPGSQYNLNNFAKFACIAGDVEVGRELFQRIGDSPYFDLWQRDDPDFEECRNKSGVIGLTRKEINLGRKNQEAVQSRILAEEGDVFSQYRVALDYSQGDVGKSQDYALAFRLAKAAAEKGYAEAQRVLGNLYSSGKGVKTDLTAATQWYERAAEQGDISAMFVLPALYQQQKNFVKAYAWFRVSRDQEWGKAGMERMAKLLPPSELARGEEEAERIQRSLASTYR